MVKTQTVDDNKKDLDKLKKLEQKWEQNREAMTQKEKDDRSKLQRKIMARESRYNKKVT